MPVLHMLHIPSRRLLGTSVVDHHSEFGFGREEDGVISTTFGHSESSEGKIPRNAGLGESRATLNGRWTDV